MDEPWHGLHSDEMRSSQNTHGATKQALHASEACPKRYDHKTACAFTGGEMSMTLKTSLFSIKQIY